MSIETTEEQRKTLALIQILKDLDIPKELLETSVITLLMAIYKGNEKGILTHLEYMGMFKENYESNIK